MNNGCPPALFMLHCVHVCS